MSIKRIANFTQWAGIESVLLAVTLLAWVAGCSPDSEMVGPPSDWRPALTPSPFLLSDPVEGAEPVFLALPTGEFPGAASTTVRNLRTGAATTIPLVLGGFDPVAVEAAAGDTVRIEVTDSGDAPPKPYFARVPATAPPIVVRTEPTAGKRDVPLNARIIIVFSEPIEPASLTGMTVQLRNGLLPVAGEIQFIDQSHLTAEFVPDVPLSSDSDYDLLITVGIEDLDGEALSKAVTVSFETVSGTTAPASLGDIAFVALGADAVQHIFVLDMEDSTLRQITSDPAADDAPVWSPDRTKIAFQRVGDSLSSGIWVVGADGSGAVRRSTMVGKPSWSPDGSQLAVMTGASMWLVSTSGSASDLKVLDSLPGLFSYYSPAWSPDGATIAFGGSFDMGGGDAMDHVYLMNADGSNVRRLTSDCSYGPCGAQFAEGSPAWSPDGARVAFWSYAYGITVANPDGSGVYSASREGLEWDGSSPATGFNAHPSWSPDGQWLVYQSPWSTGQLVVTRADGTGQLPTVVTNRPGGASSPAWAR